MGKERWGCSCSLVPTMAPPDAMEGRSQAAPLTQQQAAEATFQSEGIALLQLNFQYSCLSSRLQLHLNWAATQHSGIVAAADWWPPLLARRHICRLVDPIPLPRPILVEPGMETPKITQHGRQPPVTKRWD